jgi:hypothetical protein
MRKGGRYEGCESVFLETSQYTATVAD